MRHLLDTKTLAREDALRILDVAEDMADTQRREVKKLPTLRGKTVVNLFFEDSTRTRISFEAAAKRLSRRRHQLLGEGLERLEGRVAAGHRADAAGDGGGCRRHPPRRVRRPAHPRDERLDHARASSTPATAPTSTRRRRSWTPSRSASADSATTAAAATSRA